MAEPRFFTYQARLTLDFEQAELLDAYARLQGKVMRSAFAAMQGGRGWREVKPAFQRRFGMTARHLNSIHLELQGKLSAIRQRAPSHIDQLEGRISEALRRIKRLEMRPSRRVDKLHQKRRRLAALEHRLAQLKDDAESGLTRICFGGRKTFRAQFALTANGLQSHDEWRVKWEAARARQIFISGSRDEPCGNMLCQATAADDGTFTLRLRLPDGLQAPKWLRIAGVHLAHGAADVRTALGKMTRVWKTTASGRPYSTYSGQALTYRFLRDEKGWRVFITCAVAAPPLETSSHAGALGLDLNVNHLALAESDRFGNLVASHRIDLCLYGLDKNQRRARISDAMGEVVRLALACGKPLAIERLDLEGRKAEAEGQEPWFRRSLGSFPYRQVSNMLKAASFRAGVQVIEVTSSFTSTIGAVNHARVRGISVHQGAAFAIARRSMRLRESPTVRWALVPVRGGGHVAFELPVRNRSKHVWSHWSNIRTRLRAAHVAHARLGPWRQAPPTPLSPEARALCATWTSTAEPRGANRQQNCSADVLNDVPF